MSLAPDFIRNADTSSLTSQDKLDQCRTLAVKFYELDKEIEELEEKLATKKEEKLSIAHKELPKLLNEAQLDKVGLPEQNCDIVVGPYYKASIPAEWPVEKVESAFKVLEDLDGDDIIRAKLAVIFLKEEYEDAQELAEFIRTQWPKANMHPVTIEKSVPWTTLTKFVKDYSEDESTDPLTEEQLNALGATIGLIAKIKPRKEK